MLDPVSSLSIVVASIKTVQVAYGLIRTVQSPVADSRQSNDHVRNEVHHHRHLQRIYDDFIVAAQEQVSALQWIQKAIVCIAFTNCLRLAYETELFKDLFLLCVFLVSIFFKNLLLFLQITVLLVLASFLSFIATIHFLYDPIFSYSSLIIFCKISLVGLQILVLLAVFFHFWDARTFRDDDFSFIIGAFVFEIATVHFFYYPFLSYSLLLILGKVLLVGLQILFLVVAVIHLWEARAFKDDDLTFFVVTFVIQIATIHFVYYPFLSYSLLIIFGKIILVGLQILVLLIVFFHFRDARTFKDDDFSLIIVTFVIQIATIHFVYYPFLSYPLFVIFCKLLLVGLQILVLVAIVFYFREARAFQYDDLYFLIGSFVFEIATIHFLFYYHFLS